MAILATMFLKWALLGWCTSHGFSLRNAVLYRAMPPNHHALSSPPETTENNPVVCPIPAFHDNYIWCIRKPSLNQCALVDPGDANPVLQYLNTHQLQPTHILVTHHHQDHTGGISTLQQHTPAQVLGPAGKLWNTKHQTVRHGDVLSLMGLEFEVIATPGHTLDHVAYYNPSQGMLFCGDTLFSAGCGRLFEGTAAQMLTALSTLKALPESTRVFCAHEYTLHNLQFARMIEPDNPHILQRIKQATQQRQAHKATIPSTLYWEQRTNPFLRTHVPQVRISAQAYAKKTLNDEKAVFEVLRAWKDQF